MRKRFDVDFINESVIVCDHLFGVAPDYVHYFDNGNPSSGFDCFLKEEITIATSEDGMTTTVTFPAPISGTLTLSVVS